MRRAVFLDRDGVITQEPPHYAHKLDQLKFIAGTADAIRLLNDNGFVVIIASNQSGIARGYYREEDAALFHQAMMASLGKKGARIDAVYYCPHHPEANVDKYRVVCDCRKPAPGMLKQAEKELKLDLRQSFMVGDKLSDIESGKRVGCYTIMVKTGQGAEQLKMTGVKCDYIADDLYHAVEHILAVSTRPLSDIKQ